MINLCTLLCSVSHTRMWISWGQGYCLLLSLLYPRAYHIAWQMSRSPTNEQEPNKYLLTGSKNIALRRNLMRNSEIFKYPQSFKICNGHFWSSPQDLLLSSPNLTALDFPTMWFGTSVHALGIGFNWYKPYILFTS